MEIGSEFWEFDGNLNSNNSSFWNLGKDIKFTLSGRTAIYYVLENIAKKQKITKAYLPSYSCESMAQPFIDLGIEILYYDVYYNDGLKYNIEFLEDVDIFFAMNYFGYSNTNMDSYIQKYKNMGKIVIEDITHSIFSTKRYSVNSDYLIASLRKWMPILSGGIAVNMNSNFEIELSNKSNKEMIILKNTAMKNKKDYIEGKNTDKDGFLNEYKESSKALEKEYKNYSIDEKSLEIINKIDIQNIIKARLENAKVIYEKLKKNSKVRFLVEDYNGKDALLFVPIVLEHNLRNELRKYLIDNKVYLPVHWPLEENLNNIFEKELSLVCDQRYTKEQISNYIDLIIEFLGEK